MVIHLFLLKKGQDIKDPRCYIVCAILLWVIHAHGFSTPRIIQIDAEHSYFSKGNWMIHQDEQGKLLLANNAGFVTYDGSRWYLMEMPYQKIIRAIQYHDQKVFVGGYGEFGYWSLNENQDWNYHSLSESLDHEKIKNDEIWNIFSTGNEVIFQSFGKIFSFQKNVIKEIVPPFSINLISIVHDEMILKVNRRGLMKLMPDHSFQLISDAPSILNSRIKFVFPGSAANELILGTTTRILSLRNQHIADWPRESPTLLLNEGLNRGVQLSNNNYAIATITNGLYIISPSGRIIHHFNKSNGLQGNNVIYVYEDRDKNLWVSSDQGLDLIEFNSSL